MRKARPPAPEDPRQTNIWDAIARYRALGKAARARAVQAKAPLPRVPRRQPAIRASKRLRRYELRFRDELDSGPPLPGMPPSSQACAAVGLGTRPLPCPFLRCRYNLSIEITPRGSLRVLNPWWEPGERTAGPTCVLVESHKREHTAAQIGAILRIGINRVGQIDAAATAKMAARFGMTAGQLREAIEASRRRRNQD